jgi:hypothetical protein
MNTLPRVNGIRKEHPNAKIIFAGYEDDYIYFRDNDGNWTIDEYWGFEWWPTDRGVHLAKGFIPDYVQKLRVKFNSRTPRDGKSYFIDSSVLNLDMYSREFKANLRFFYPFKNIVTKEDKIADGNHIVVYARAKNYGGLNFRSWRPENWHKFMNLLLDKLDDTFYVCGVGAESIQFDWSDRLINMTDKTGSDRSSKTLNILSNAKFCISDCSGSGNFAIQAGIPTFVSGPKEYHRGFTNTKNHFGVHVHYQNTHMPDLTPEQRMEGLKEFLKNLHYNLDREVLEECYEA